VKAQSAIKLSLITKTYHEENKTFAPQAYT